MIVTGEADALVYWRLNIYASFSRPSVSLFSPNRGEFDGGGDIEKATLPEFQRHFMQFATSRADAVFQNHHLVSEIARASCRPFDTAFCGDAADHNRFDAITPEHEIEVRSDKCVRPAFLKHDILRLGFQLRDDFPVVRIILLV